MSHVTRCILDWLFSSTNEMFGIAARSDPWAVVKRSRPPIPAQIHKQLGSMDYLTVTSNTTEDAHNCCQLPR